MGVKGAWPHPSFEPESTPGPGAYNLNQWHAQKFGHVSEVKCLKDPEDDVGPGPGAYPDVAPRLGPSHSSSSLLLFSSSLLLILLPSHLFPISSYQ